ncbi:hypothetical protein NUW54_g10030 [Trametes sanguinea]|uniref:Uncharacterized protein n=1 Tax=Trametes sanguinea TaxID=158606 RepID=A0ACC1P477_9APHY|nr:hypothetical protein NUW54_g10030 [Trametes sanguinea]
MSTSASLFNVQSAGLFVSRYQFLDSNAVMMRVYMARIRAGLFYACRRFLLRTLYHDLQDLSAKAANAPGTPVVVFDAGETELETLPTSSSVGAATTSNLPRKRPFHSALSRGLFSLCFSETCTLFLLLILQALDMFSPSLIIYSHTRWHASAYIHPIDALASHSDRYGLPGHTVWIRSDRYCMGLLPSPHAAVKVRTLGIAIEQSDVDTWVTKRPHPTDEEVRSAESGLQRVREDLAQRQKDLRLLQASKQSEAPSSWFSRALPSWQGNGESSSLAQEITGLEALEYEMSRNLDALKQRQAESKFSKTFAGRVFNWGGRLFSLYCIYRIFASLVNLVLPRSPPSAPGESTSTNADVISFVLAYLFSHLPFVHLPQDKIAVISRQISLGFVGIIILSSIRRVLRGVARLLRVTSRSLGASLMLLTLAQVMGIYLLSTLIQLRTSFPPPPARPDVDADEGTVNLFATLPEYQFFGPLFDGAFLLAAAVTAAVRWLGDRVTE